MNSLWIIGAALVIAILIGANWLASRKPQGSACGAHPVAGPLAQRREMRLRGKGKGVRLQHRIRFFDPEHPASFTEIFAAFRTKAKLVSRQQRRRLEFQTEFARLTKEFDIPRSVRRRIARERVTGRERRAGKEAA
jgi:hypothetical protein